MIRDAARAYLPGQAAAARARGQPPRDLRPRDHERDGRAGPARRHDPGGIGCAGVNYVSYGLIAREVERVDSGYRSAMSRAVVAGDVPDLRLRHRRAAQDSYLPKLAHRRMGRLLRPDRARRRLRPRLHEHAGEEGRWRLSRLGRQDLDHQLADRRRRRRLGEGRRRQDPRLHPRARHEGPRPTPKIEGKFSLRASITGMIMMDEVFVPEENLLPA